MIRLGVCTGPANVDKVAQIGFDYIEFGLASIAAMTEEEFNALAQKMDESPIKAEAYNGMLPASVPVTGPNVNASQQHEYLELAFSRGAAIGVKLVVFGSGGARAVPEGWSFARAWRQLTDFLELAAEYAEKYDIVIALEPLRSSECNILNYVSEGTALCGIVNHPYITVLGDFFHMYLGSEPWEHLARAGEKLSHIHICNPVGRLFPAVGDGFDYESVIKVLKDMGYKGDISVEASAKDLEKDSYAAAEAIKPLL